MEEHSCLNCGGPIIKKKHESQARYSNKKYCSTKCSHEYMRIHRIGWFGADEDVKRDNQE